MRFSKIPNKKNYNNNLFENLLIFFKKIYYEILNKKNNKSYNLIIIFFINYIVSIINKLFTFKFFLKMI